VGSSLCFYVVIMFIYFLYGDLFQQKYTHFCINCACFGYVKINIIANIDSFTVEECAANLVGLALLPYGSPSCVYYNRNEVSSLWLIANKRV